MQEIKTQWATIDGLYPYTPPKKQIRRRLTKGEVIEIYTNTMSHADAAKKFGAAYKNIVYIRRGKTHLGITRGLVVSKDVLFARKKRNK